MRVAVAVVLCCALACGGDDDGGSARPDAANPTADAGPPDADPGPELLVEYLDPDHGPFAGGTEVLLRGRGFREGMTVTIGGRLVDPADLQIVDERRALLATPPGDPGPADVAVSVDDGAGGTLTATGAGAYRYEAVYVEPPSGAVGGGTYVRIHGHGTTFSDGDVVTFDGAVLGAVAVISETELTGITPPGVAGDADVMVSGAGGTVLAPAAYRYTSGADPSGGGFAGGPIMGTLDVAVVDTFTDTGVEGAFVLMHDAAGTWRHGFTDAFGHVTFAAPGLVGPVSVHAGKEGYERQSFVSFDARDVIMFVLPQPTKQPPGGPFPPGRLGAVVRGEIVFGDVTGVGVPTWDLVPEPRRPSERKRAIVIPTASSAFAAMPAQQAGGVIDWTDDGAIAWPFDISTRASALAVVAVAGLYDEDTKEFEPFAMGVARGLLLGPGETLENVTIVVDIPLDAAVRVELVDAPPLGSPRWPGPNQYTVRAVVDLGGEGVVRLPNSELVLPPGADAITMPGMPPLLRAVGDASYTVIAGAYTSGGSPQSVRVVRGVDDIAVPLAVAGFLGVPRPEDPLPGQTASWMHLAWAPEGGGGAASMSYHRVVTNEFLASPEWRLYARGGQRDLRLPDLVSVGGVPPVPANRELVWSFYEITLAAGDFDDFTYRLININQWSAYATDTVVVKLPANP